ncbi:MAG TPA: hypothetical protein VGX28_16920 [Frankiaceae bacterium]|jgi:hypothetical protein|nr:hypothetical protein [Frankiaceae bacterium]
MPYRKRAVLGMLVATVVATAPPANAHTQVALTAGGTYTGVIANGLTVTFNCTATGAGDVVSVAITECRLSTGEDNHTAAFPGTTATVNGVETVPFAPFVLCYTAVFTFSDAHTRTLSGCNELLPSADGMPQLVGGGLTMA